MNAKCLVPALALTSFTTLLANPIHSPQSDKARGDSINCFLERSPKMDGSSFDISVTDHIASISASVRTLDQAEWIVSSVYATDEIYGAVQNISYQTTGCDKAVTENEIGHQLSHALVLEGSFLSARVEQNGHVILVGEVPTLDQLEAARELVSRIEGVRSISAEVEVNPLALCSPRSIESYLGLRSEDDPLLFGSTINYSFDDGALTISGKVPSLELKERVAINSMVGGVMTCNVDNLVVAPSIKTAGMSEKHYLIEDAKHALTLIIDKDPRIQSGQLSLKIENERHLTIAGDVIEESTAKAILENCRGLPGLPSIQHHYTINTDSPLNQSASN